MSELITKIQNYFDGTLQYPLLAVVPSDEYNDVLSGYANTPKIKVSDYCVGRDKEPDLDELIKDVKNSQGNHLLLGLGNYLSSKLDIARQTLSAYKDLILQDNCHIAVVLSAHMYPYVKELQQDPRYRTRLVLPKNEPQIATIDSKEWVQGLKAYLDACEKGVSVNSVTTGRYIYGDVIVIRPENAYDALKHKFTHTFDKLPQTVGTSQNWGELLEHIKKSNKNIDQYLDDQHFDPYEYRFFDFAKKSDYEAWLYFIALKLKTIPQTYLGYVATKTNTQSELFENAKSAILDIGIKENKFRKFYDERKILLKNCNDTDMANFSPQTYAKGENRIAYLTDITKVERKAIIKAICEGAKIDCLAQAYPDLYAYLQNYQFENNEFTSYFADYKKCKVSNYIDDSFANKVSENAITRPYNSLPSRSSVFTEINGKNTILIFLDAFGVEFLGYVKSKCGELGLRFDCTIARASLPTITSLNKDFFDDWDGVKYSIKDIDELKHHPEKGYDYNNSKLPIHLVDELEIVNTALNRAKQELETGSCRKIIIASDHGASRLAVISEGSQKDSNFCESLSSGRYCKGENLPTGENIAREGEFAVLSDYSRFSGSRVASVEVHGGATLEEVIVPIIELTLKDSNIQVTVENREIEVSYNKIAELVIYITPDCDNITASVNGEFYDVEKLEKSKYKVSMPDLKNAGTYALDVFENQNSIDSKKFTIKKKGFTERDLF